MLYTGHYNCTAPAVCCFQSSLSVAQLEWVRTVLVTVVMGEGRDCCYRMPATSARIFWPAQFVCLKLLLKLVESGVISSDHGSHSFQSWDSQRHRPIEIKPGCYRERTKEISRHFWLFCPKNKICKSSTTPRVLLRQSACLNAVFEMDTSV